MADSRLKISDERINKIVDSISSNCPYQVAAWGAGICETTLFDWLKTGKEDIANDIDSLYSRLAKSVKEAEHNKMKDHLSVIQSATDGEEKNWQARAWILERRWRQYFGQDAAQLAEIKQMHSEMKEMTKGKSDDKK